MVNSTIGERLKTFRKSKRLIGEAFGEMLNLGKAGVAHIEAGRQNLSIEQLKLLIKLFPELNVYWLVAGKGEMYITESEKEAAEIKPAWEKLKKGNPPYEQLLQEYCELSKNVKKLKLDFNLNDSINRSY